MCRPANPFRSALITAGLFLVFAVAISLANGSLRSGAWMFVLAGIEGAEALLIRYGAPKSVRIPVRIAWLLLAFGFWWLWRR